MFYAFEELEYHRICWVDNDEPLQFSNRLIVLSRVFASDGVL